eukprot:g71955.t1
MLQARRKRQLSRRNGSKYKNEYLAQLLSRRRRQLRSIKRKMRLPKNAATKKKMCLAALEKAVQLLAPGSPHPLRSLLNKQKPLVGEILPEDPVTKTRLAGARPQTEAGPGAQLRAEAGAQLRAEAGAQFKPSAVSYYATTGIYTVLIEGRLDGLLSMVTRNNEHRIKFQAIYSWGNVSLSSPPAYMLDGTLLSGVLPATSAPYWAYASNALTELFYLAPTSGTRALERVTRADYLLYNARELVGDLSDWRIPFNGSATYAFAYATKFNQDISAWPMSGITNTSFMFTGAEEFDQPLDPWGVSSTNMQFMFDGAVKFNQPLSSWNQRGTLITIRGMFNAAVAFNQPLGAWNMSALVTNFDPTGDGSPFRTCCRFMQDLSAWSRPTTLASCQGVASDSRLTYAMLPTACCAFPPESYTWWDYTQSCVV